MVASIDFVVGVPSLREPQTNDNTVLYSAALIVEAWALLHDLHRRRREFLSQMTELGAETSERIFQSRKLLRLIDIQMAAENRLDGWT